MEHCKTLIPIGFDEIHVKDRVRVTPEGYKPAQYVFKFTVPSGAAGGPSTYRTGDHFGLVPCNPPELVDRLLMWLGKDPMRAHEELVEVTSEDPLRAFPGMPMTLHRLLSQFVDLNGPVPYYLRRLVSPDTGFVPPEAVAHKNAAEAIMSLPKGKYSFSEIVSACDIIHPRFYSIASSDTRCPDEIELLVVDVPGGLCTGHICRQPLEYIQTTPIAGKLRKGVFNYPMDGNTPMVCVTVGSGFAPVRAFLQERKDRGLSGDFVLVHGCRHASKDFVCQEDIQDGGVSASFYAFSRDDPKKKVYIHDKIAENGAAVWELLQRPDCQFFYCGSSGKILNQMETALIKCSEGICDGGSIIRQMKGEHRYHLEAY